MTSSNTLARPSTRPDDSGRVGGDRPATRRRRSEPLLTWGALVITTVLGLLVLGALSRSTDEADATVLSFVAPESGATSVLARVVLFVATAVVAGLGLTRALVGLRPAGVASLRVARVAGATAVAAALAGGVLGDAAWPWALGHAALVVAAVALLPHGPGDIRGSTPTGKRSSTTRRPASTVGPVAVVLTAVLAAEVAAGRHGVALALELVASVATTVALGIAVGVTTESTRPVASLATSSTRPVASLATLSTRPVASLATLSPPHSEDADEGRFDRVARRRVTVTGVAAATVALLHGPGIIAVSGPWTVHDLVATPSGLASLARTLLPLLAVAVLAATAAGRSSGPSLRSPRRRSPARRATDDPERPAAVGAHRRREAARWAALAIGGTVAAAGVLGALPSPPDAPEAGRATLRPVQLGLERMALLVAPSPGGPTLMRISPAEEPDGAAAHDHRTVRPVPAGYSVRAGGTSTRFTPRPGAPGAWALVDLPADTGSVSVQGPGGTATVPVATGAPSPVTAALAGPDGPECADALLGDRLGGGAGVPACPGQGLDPQDARALELIVADLHQRGLGALYTVGDSSPRSRAATQVVAGAAARVGMPVRTTVRGTPAPAPRPDDGLLVLTGWEGAHATLTDVTAAATRAPTFTGGQFLAPWLVTPGVLAAGSSTMFPLGFVPQEPMPRGYAATLTTMFADAAPTATGYRAWSRARGVPEGGIRLYGAAAMDVMPGMPGMNHGDRAGAWLPGGSVIPISAVLS